MRKRAWIIAGAVVCVCVAIVVYVAYERLQRGRVPEGTVVVPDFTFPDASGSSVTLNAITAKVRVIHFWASWSPYSKDELPALVRLKQMFGDDIAIVALDRDADPSEGRAYLASLGLGRELLFAYDKDDTYFKQVGGYAMPETVFVGPKGEVLAHIRGPMSEEEMRTTVTALLGK